METIELPGKHKQKKKQVLETREDRYQARQAEKQREAEMAERARAIAEVEAAIASGEDFETRSPTPIIPADSRQASPQPAVHLPIIAPPQQPSTPLPPAHLGDPSPEAAPLSPPLQSPEAVLPSVTQNPVLSPDSSTSPLPLSSIPMAARTPSPATPPSNEDRDTGMRSQSPDSADLLPIARQFAPNSSPNWLTVPEEPAHTMIPTPSPNFMIPPAALRAPSMSPLANAMPLPTTTQQFTFPPVPTPIATPNNTPNSVLNSIIRATSSGAARPPLLPNIPPAWMGIPGALPIPFYGAGQGMYGHILPNRPPPPPIPHLQQFQPAAFPGGPSFNEPPYLGMRFNPLNPVNLDPASAMTLFVSRAAEELKVPGPPSGPK